MEIRAEAAQFLFGEDKNRIFLCSMYYYISNWGQGEKATLRNNKIRGFYWKVAFRMLRFLFDFLYCIFSLYAVTVG